MDKVTQENVATQCDALRKALDKTLTEFNLHAAMVIMVGNIDGLEEHVGYTSMLVTGCEDCAAGALAHAIRKLPEGMREPLLRAWRIEVDEASRSSKTVQ